MRARILKIAILLFYTISSMVSFSYANIESRADSSSLDSIIKSKAL